jgi:uncharacterized protein YkwD
VCQLLENNPTLRGAAARLLGCNTGATTRLHMLSARLSLVMFMVALLLSGLRSSQAMAASNVITGDLPTSGGIALVVWSGGTPADLQAAAGTRGCTLMAAWVTNGNLVGYVFGAPSIVNASFLQVYPSSIPANTAVLAVCRGAQPAPLPATSSSDVDIQLAQLIFQGLNSERTSHGLPALVESPILDRTADKYAPVVQANVTLNHELGGQEPWDRAQAEGYPTMNVGEILAARIFGGGYDIPTEARNFVNQWMNSPSVWKNAASGEYFSRAGYASAQRFSTSAVLPGRRV